MEVHITDRIRKFLTEITKENANNYAIEIKTDTGKCEGFSSVIVPVDLVSDGDCIELILKIGPSETLRKTIPFEKVFQREAFIYDTVLPEFHRLQLQHKIPDVLLFNNYPKCFKTSLDYLDEVLILENLSGSKQYKLWDKRVPMDKFHVELVLRTYAKLHSLSLVLRKTNPDKLSDIAKNTQDVYMNIIRNCGTIDIIKNLIKRTMNALDGEEVMVEKLGKFQEHLIEIMDDLTLVNASGEYSVVGHGDNWTNNLLFKYEEGETKKPIDVKFIDWQLSRYGSPVMDLSYFLYSCVDEEHLKTLDHYLKIYHESLSSHLKLFNISTEELFPWTVLQEHWKKFAKFGLQMSFLVVHVSVMSEAETPKVDGASSEDFLKAFEASSVNDEVYINRMKCIVQHFIDNDFL